MNNPIVIAIIAWLVPGAGHVAQKRLTRGLVLGGAISTMFLIGLFTGGAYYPGFEFKDGQLLVILNTFAKLGNGLGWIISFLASVEPSPNVAAQATFEYSGRFIETAGLLNFLAIMDALDIYFGRKK